MSMLIRRCKPVLSALKPIVRRLLAPLDRVRLRRLAARGGPYGTRLARVIRRVRTCDVGEGRDLIRRIEQERAALLRRGAPLVDGALGEGGPYDGGYSVRDVCGASKGPRRALLLHLLAREFRPARAVELGTNVGISSAYLAAALKLNAPDATLVTLEASPYRARLARELHAELDLRNVRCEQGLFEDTLVGALQEQAPIDFAFIDGHHLYEPTMKYFQMIWEHGAENAVLVFDDIRQSGEMKRAWAEVCADPRIVVALDLVTLGVCVATRRNGTEAR